MGTNQSRAHFRRFSISLAFAAAALLLPRQASGFACLWDGSSSTSWTTAANWSTCNSTTPQSGDTVTINSGGNQPSLSASAAVGQITLGAGAVLTIASGGALTLQNGLTGGGNLTVNSGGTLNWDQGSMGGAGTTTISSGGNLNLAVGTVTLDTRALNNSGDATFSGAHYLYLANGGNFNNLAAGSFEAQSDYGIYPSGAPGTFSNAGAFTRTTTSGTFTVNVPIINTGSVVVNSGTLTLSGAGTQTHTGTFNATGGTLRFSTGTHNLNAGANVTGSNVAFDSGTVSINSTYNVTGTTSVTGGAVNFNAASTVTNIGANLAFTSGTANFNSGETLTPTALNMTGGTLAGSDTVTISGLFTFNGGTLGGSGTVNANGGIDMTSGTRYIDTRTLRNAGTATYGAVGYMYLQNGGVFNNLATGTFDAQSDYGIYPSGTPGTFTNAGTFNRTTSSGLFTVNVPVTNTGSVVVNSGTLTFSGAGTQTHTGTFIHGGTLRFATGTHNLNAGANVSGTNVAFDSGTISINSTYNVTGTTTVAGAAVNFNAASTVTNIGANLVFTSGTANFNSGAAITPATLNMTGGTLAGSDTVTISGLFSFNGGTLGGSGTVNANGGIDMVSGTRYIDTRTLRNAGTATYGAVGYMYLQNGGVFNNLATGTFEAQSDYGIYPSGTPGSFINAGTFTRTTSSGLFTVNVPITNTGSVVVNSGTLTLSGAGTQTHTGTFNSTGGTLRFATGTHNLNSGANVSGTNVAFDSGTVNINSIYNLTGSSTTVAGATVNFNAASTVTSIGTNLIISSGTVNFNSGETIAPTTVNMTGGTLAGSDTVTISGLFSFNGGTLGGSGTVNANGGIDMTSGTRYIDARTLRNAGTATYGAVGYMYLQNGGIFNNLAAGTFNAQSDYGIYPSGTPGNFTNAGTFTRSTSSGTFTVNAPFTNTGTVNAQSGTLTFSGTYTQTAGATHLNGGNLNTGSSSLGIQGGVLDGNGTITGNVSVSASGQFNPGDSPGEISITGTYSQAAPGVMNVEINGVNPGFDYDRTLVSGAANLAGTLNVTLGFTPAVGDSFTILTHGSRTGTFGTFTATSPGAGRGWDLSYGATQTTLTVAQALAVLMNVDSRAAAGTVSDANGVLEPGERVVVEPSWLNMTESTFTLSGTASNFTGPSAAGVAYSLPDNAAAYGTLNANTTVNCFDATGNCYQVQIAGGARQPDARPLTHWDATFQEAGSGGTNKTWTLHVGDSFTDVPRSQLFYKRIETLLHTGVTAGCTPTEYCPTQPVPRGQMAIFVAKVLAGGGPNIPNSGTVGVAPPKPYNCVAGASGATVFSDVLPTDIYCKHVHYIAAQNVTLGCTTTTYCPAGVITRIEMAAFIAKAVVAPAGGAGVPLAYGPDPVTGFSYNCNGSNIHFSDVPASNTFCKHVHYLWARGFVSGTSPTQFGPTGVVTRDAMARFLSNAFNLLLYGPVP